MVYRTRVFLHVSDPYLKSLVPSVTSTLASTTARSTSTSYLSHFKKWKVWCSQFVEVNYFPADEIYVALYLVNLLQSGSSFSTIQSTFYAISFFHKLNIGANTCDSPFLRSVLSGCKRIDAAKPRTSKHRLPVLPEHLQSLVSRFAGPSASLSDIRDVTFCLLGFAEFMRFNELSSIMWSQ